VRREGLVLTNPYLPPGEARRNERLACGEHDPLWWSMEEEQQRRRSVYRPSPPPVYSHSPPVAYPHPAAYPTHVYPHAPPYPPAPMYSSLPLYPPPPGYPHGYPAHRTRRIRRLWVRHHLIRTIHHHTISIPSTGRTYTRLGL
jgi:hypothetical protein